MSKLILIIVVVVVIAMVLGLYFIFLNSDKGTGLPQGQNTENTGVALKTFDVKGVKVEVLKEGTGAQAKTGDSVTVNYVGTLTDGTKFDSSIDRNSPFTFKLGAGRVIQGWDIGVLGMKVGEKRKLTIPADLAYGPSKIGVIPANAVLTFEIELLKIN